MVAVVLLALSVVVLVNVLPIREQKRLPKS